MTYPTPSCMTNIAEEVQLYGWTIYSKHTAMESMVSTVYITIQQIILFVFLALQSNTCVVLFKKTHSEAIKKSWFPACFFTKNKIGCYIYLLSWVCPHGKLRAHSWARLRVSIDTCSTCSAMPTGGITGIFSLGLIESSRSQWFSLLSESRKRDQFC